MSTVAMKMEIKADVHTVHPSSASSGPEAPTCKPYGSWCTPEATPHHATLTHTNSNIESKAEIHEEHNNAKNVFFQLQKIRLFSSPPPKYNSIIDVKEAATELKDFKVPQSRGNSIKRCSPVLEKSVSSIEIPQSPVPSSPLREKKCKGLLRLLPLCDPFVPIDPQGRGYISWLMLVTFCYSYNAWCIALRATFPYQTPENTPLWMTTDYLCDLIYLVDVALVKPRLMFLHEGFWVNDAGETRRNYRKKLQYKFDVISLLPLDILYLYFGTHMVILRAPRLLKLQTFWEFHQAMDRVLSSPYVVRIGKTLFYIFYLIHLNACAYYAMSNYIGLDSNGWVYDNKGNAYIRCFYFATKTATSIGKNPKPEKTEEYLFMTAAWLMGVFVFALLIGQIRDIIATATRARTEYRKKVDSTSRYLRQLNMPVALQRRVTCWFNYTWSQQRCFDESKILNSLPYNMKRDVALAVHMTTLSKVELFSNCSASLLRDLVLQLRPVSFLPGDRVVRAGDVGHQMYIIKSGECCVMSPDDKEVLATLKEGMVFGEISLLGIEGLRRRTATVISRGYSSLFALSRNDLEAALKYHKEAAQVLRLRADQIIRQNAARQAKQRLAILEAKKSNHSETSGVRNRRLSSASSNDSSLPEKRHRSASALSHNKRRLSAVSENKVHFERPSNASACSRGPLPTIVLSSECE
ncbi:cyclic nucleotide-gated cation channel beta-3 isoform X2 [Plodia interpunctella]|uniref:cyclic nucleotide-gated cation channel beta-3 isoform X2 n=1 Tax=Plodia interpunctella TaxID=58824 RepID=UPI0023683CCC|nr:cyclic nucleotide-gated cation channel beta-3 isoform X2 [Plodia interpunctella]